MINTFILICSSFSLINRQISIKRIISAESTVLIQIIAISILVLRMMPVNSVIIWVVVLMMGISSWHMINKKVEIQVFLVLRNIGRYLICIFLFFWRHLDLGFCYFLYFWLRNSFYFFLFNFTSSLISIFLLLIIINERYSDGQRC